MKKVLMASLLATLTFISCQKDLSSGPDMPQTGTPIPAAAPVSGSVAGIVVNDANAPVANAIVRVAGTVYTTDSKGYFRTASHTLDKNITTVKVTSPGYFTGYRSFSATADRNYVTIKLIPKTLAGTFNSSTSGLITLPNGSNLSFQAGSINIKSTGVSYSGTVNVYAAYIDPTTQDFLARVPGSLMAMDASRFFILKSAGMMAVEMESTSGEPLQLAANKPAQMKMIIPATLLSKVPSTIDTWSLDDRGIWIKEGTATKNGNSYDLSVSHFSFWNCDVPANAVFLTIHLKDQNNHDLVNTGVMLASGLWGTTGGLTDQHGNVSGYVPANDGLNMTVFANLLTCNSPLYTQAIGPYAVNSTENFTITITPAQTLTVSGTVQNCTGQPVATGTAIIYSNLHQVATPILNGAWSISFPVCTAVTTLDVIVIDNSTMQQSATVSVAVNAGVANAGVLAACGTSIDEYINYILDGTAYSISSANSGAGFYGYVSSSTTFLSAYNQSSGNSIGFGTSGAATGTFSISSDSMQVNTISQAIPQSTATNTITAFGTIGQFLEGSFNIPFEATGSVHTLTGNYRIKRDQ